MMPVHALNTISMIPLISLDNARVYQEPFNFMVATNTLSKSFTKALLHDLPNTRLAGYFPYHKNQCGPTLNHLIQQLQSEPMAAEIGRRLGIDHLYEYPPYISISRFLERRHGRIHTDGESKVATALLYLNPVWTREGNGCLRFLENEMDFSATVIPEIKPLYGTLAAFRRSGNSYHGHLPFKGERNVIQVSWFKSEQDLVRQSKRGRVTEILKSLF